jgi:hypothetical protein
MPKNVFNILAPAGGLYKRRSYQEHPPFTTADCDNVWLDDTIDGRERVGSRPGFATVGTAKAGGIVRCMASVVWQSTNAVRKVTLVAVVDSRIVYSTNDGATWTTHATTLNSDADYGPLVAAELHQKLYIPDSGRTGLRHWPG